MKKTILTLASVLFCAITFAQTVPQGINYQAVVRDSSGNTLVQFPLSLEVSIIRNDANGPIDYQETHSVTTNDFGMITFIIGQGTIVSGTFSNLGWENYLYLLKLRVDYGSGYVLLSLDPLMSVPYALGSGGDADWRVIGNNSTGYEQHSIPDKGVGIGAVPGPNQPPNSLNAKLEVNDVPNDYPFTIRATADDGSVVMDAVSDGEGDGIRITLGGGNFGKALKIEQGGNGDGIAVHNLGDGDGIWVDHAGTGDGVKVDHTGSAGDGMIVARDGIGDGIKVEKTGDGDGIKVEKTGDGDGIRVEKTGDGQGIWVDKDGDGHGIWVDQVGDGNGIWVDKDGAGAGIGVNQDGDGHGISVDQVGDGDGVKVDMIGDGNGVKVDMIGDGDGIWIDQDGNGDGVSVDMSEDGIGMVVHHVGDGDGVKVHMIGDGDGIWVDQFGDGDGVKVDHTGSAGDGMSVVRDGIGDGIKVEKTGDGQGIYVEQDGIGDGIKVEKTGDGQGIWVDQVGDGEGIRVDHTGAGAGIKIDKTESNGVGMEMNHASHGDGIIINKSDGTGSSVMITHDSPYAYYCDAAVYVESKYTNAIIGYAKNASSGRAGVHAVGTGSRDSSGALLINHGAVRVAGTSPIGSQAFSPLFFNPIYTQNYPCPNCAHTHVQGWEGEVTLVNEYLEAGYTYLQITLEHPDYSFFASIKEINDGYATIKIYTPNVNYDSFSSDVKLHYSIVGQLW